MNMEVDNTQLVCQLQTDIKKMFNNPLCSDVEIVIGEQVFKGHKLILSRNPTFCNIFAAKPLLKRILLSDLRPDLKTIIKSHVNKNLEQQEEIFGVPLEACETFLRYLYVTEMEKDKINLDLILVAHKLSDELLKDFCENLLINDVSMVNASRALLVSLETNCDKLKDKTCELIGKNFCAMKFEKDFALVLQNKTALIEIFRVLDKCDTFLFTESKDCDKNKENSIEYLRNSDLLITVGNDNFLAHKNILSERNAVLKNMIDAASREGFPTSINVLDVLSRTFDVFMHYIYSGELLKHNISEDLLALAHDFNDEKLKEICEQHFLETLNCENVIELLLMAIKYKCIQLETNAKNFIVVRYDQISAQTAYLDLLQNPTAANAVMKAFSKSQQDISSKNYFHGRFVLAVPVSYDDVYSDDFVVKNERWYIGIERNEARKSLGIYLDFSSEDPQFCVQIHCSLKLISTIAERFNITIRFNHKYTTDGARTFNLIKFSNLENPNYGYMTNGKIIVEVDVTAV